MKDKKRLNIRLIVAVVLALLTLVMIVQNREPVETTILFIPITMPRALLLAITLVIGFVIGLLTAVRMERKDKGPK